MWFTETPWPPIIILSVFGVGFVIMALQTQRTQWLVAIGITILLAVGVWFIERSIVTPAEQVEANLLALLDAFQKNNEPEMLKYISPANAGLVALAKAGMQIVDIDLDYRVTDTRVKMYGKNTGATIHFRVNSTIRMASQGNIGHKPFRFNGSWRIEAGQWRMTEIEELDPINGEVLNRFHLLK